jgi:3D (Asp-Asp-Asp) domain-containing protein
LNKIVLSLTILIKEEFMKTLLAGVALASLIHSHPIHMQVTGYTAGYESTGKQQTDPAYKVTASGKTAVQGITVAAGKDIPFDTKIYIPYFDGKEGFNNHGIFIVQDRGGAIHDNNIDVYFDNVQDALQFGRRNLDVYILGKDDVVMSEEKDKDRKRREEFNKEEQTPAPKNKKRTNTRKNQKIYPRFEDDIRPKSILLVLCTVCGIPLKIPKELEGDILRAEYMTCPHCRQDSPITLELKEFIARG